MGDGGKKRRECLAAIYDELSRCAVVTIMGAVAAELHSLGHRPNFFDLQHAMGLAPPSASASPSANPTAGSSSWTATNRCS